MRACYFNIPLWHNVFFFFLHCHQKHSWSICVFALVVCFGVAVCLLCVLPSPVWRFRYALGMRLCMLSQSLSVCAVAGQALVVTVEPRAATVRQGESVSFKCQVSGGLPVLILWMKVNNQPLQGQQIKKTPCSDIITSVKFHWIILFTYRQCECGSIGADGFKCPTWKPGPVPLHSKKHGWPQLSNCCAKCQMWACYHDSFWNCSFPIRVFGLDFRLSRTKGSY